MDLGERTRCISITWALLIIVCQAMCESHYIGGSPSQNLALTMPTLNAAYYSHRILFLTGLCTLSLTLLGCLGKFWCSALAETILTGCHFLKKDVFAAAVAAERVAKLRAWTPMLRARRVLCGQHYPPKRPVSWR